MEASEHLVQPSFFMLVFLTLFILHNWSHDTTALSIQVLAPATPPAPTHHATVIVPAPVQAVLPHHVTVVTMGPSSVINTVSTSRQNLDTIVQVRQVAPLQACKMTNLYFVSAASALFKVLNVWWSEDTIKLTFVSAKYFSIDRWIRTGCYFGFNPLGGAVVAGITQSNFAPFRQSSTSRAPRRRAAPARRSSGGRSSSHQGASCLMPLARTRPQTATGPTTARCHEFPSWCHARPSCTHT